MERARLVGKRVERVERVERARRMGMAGEQKGSGEGRVWSVKGARAERAGTGRSLYLLPADAGMTYGRVLPVHLEAVSRIAARLLRPLLYFLSYSSRVIMISSSVNTRGDPGPECFFRAFANLSEIFKENFYGSKLCDTKILIIRSQPRDTLNLR